MRDDRQLGRTAAEALAHWLHVMRPDWDHPGIVSALYRAKARPDNPDAYTIAVAATRAAADPGNRTPAIIPLDGAHWRAPAAQHEPTHTPPRREALTCGDCGRLKTPAEPHRCEPTAHPETVADARRRIREGHSE